MNQSELEVGEGSQNLCDEKGGEADLRRTLASPSRPPALMNQSELEECWCILLLFGI